MRELKIGDKVKINDLGITGIVTGEDSMGYNVEFIDKKGHVGHRLFIIEELSVAGDATEESARQNAAAAKSSLDGLTDRALPKKV